jgi:protein ImuB
VQRLIVAQPELNGRAVVLHQRDARRGELVRACSAAACQLGIQPGMPLAEAAALGRPAESRAVESAEPPHFAPHDPHRDRQALIDLALRCGSFSPLVGLNESDPPDGLNLDITGVTKLFGGEAVLAQRVRGFFEQRGYRVQIAIADTSGAAGAVARWSAVQIVPPGDRTQLADLPVAALGLPAGIEQQMQHLGLRRIGQLQALPRGSLGARLGKDLLARLDRLTGATAEALVACRPQPDLAVQQSFEHALSDRETIERVLQQLLEQLSGKLIARGHGVLQLDCCLVCQNGVTRTIRVGFFQPAVDPQHLAALARLQLERLDLPDGVRQIRVAAVSTAPRDRRQGGLFADVSAGDPAQLAQLVERLSNRLGRERVVRPQLQADAQAERAYRCVPLTGERQPRAEPAAPDRLWSPMFRPLKLLDPPRSIDVIGIALDGPPAVFFDRRQTHRIARSFGPERIETGWWRGPSCRRDYYRVETDSGHRFWLFRRLQDQRWFLHGEFI